MRNDRIAAIDGIRGFSILYVMLLHATNVLPAAFYSEGIYKLIMNGTFGVPLFLCISGFLIFDSFNRISNTSTNPIRNFYFRRAFKILPLWWIIITAYYLIGIITGHQALAYFTFFFGFDFKSYNQIFVSWSLFTEEVFYFFLPLVFKYLKKYWNAVQFFVITFFIAQITRKVSVNAGNNALFYLHLFVIGILIKHADVSGKLKSSIGQSSGFKFFGILDMAALSVFLFPFWNIWIGLEIPVPVVFLAMVYGRGVFNWLANTMFLRVHGRICFSLYLFHPLVIYYLEPIKRNLFEISKFNQLIGEFQLLAWFPIVWIPTFIVAYVSYYLIEKPMIEFGNSWIKQRYEISPQVVGPKP